MKLKRFLALVVSLSMVLSIVPAFSITAGAAAYVSGNTFTYDGVTYDVKSDNLVYNGDFSVTSTDSSGNTVIDGWTAGFNNTIQTMDTRNYNKTNTGLWSIGDMYYTYTAATDSSSAYITTPAYNSNGEGWFNYPWNPGDACCFAAIHNWFVDSDGNYLKAEAGQTYYMTFKIKVPDISKSSSKQWVNMGAYKVEPGTRPGSMLHDTSYSVMNNPIVPAVYTTANDTWAKVETVATATEEGYFMFQECWATDYGTESFTDFEIYKVEAQASSATTIQNALNGLSIDNSTNGENITLPTTATDVLGTEVAVTWTSSNTSLVTNDGVYANTSDSISTVTLTPSATFEGATVTGNAITVMVFPKSRAGEQYSTGDAYYEIGTSNIIETSGTAASFDENGAFSLKGWKSDNQTDFSSIDVVNGVDYFVAMEQESGWSKGAELAGTYYTPDGDWSVGTRWHDGLGGLCTFNTVWAVEPGTYYMSFYAKSMSGVTGEKGIWAFFTTEQKFGSAPTDWGTTSQLNRVTTTTEWQKYEYVFDVTEAGYIGFFGYNLGQSNNWSYTVKNYFDNFELYEMTEIESYTVTLNITGTDGSVVKTLSDVALEGESVSFDAQSFTANGVFYTTEAKTYTNVTADATYTLAATADATRIATTNNFSYNFNTGEVIWAGDRGFNSADKSGTVSIGWTNFRQTIMTFPIPVLEGEVIGNIDLTVQIGASNTDNPRYNVYAIDPSLVGDGTMDPQITGYANDDLSAGVAALGGVLLASQRVTVGSANTITLDLSNAISLTNDGTLALLITSEDLVYTYSSTTAYPPYLSTTYTTISSITYNLKYVDESGNEIGEGLATTVDYVPGTQYGYNNEVICPNLSIPAISGYIFKNKSVSGTTITLTYAVDSQDDYFFNNITDMDTRFVSLNMLGSHDAFTAGVDETRYDAAGVAAENESARNAMTFGSLSTSMSVTQDLTAVGQLQAGARYFDTRLSRSTSDASYLLKTAPHTNGVFYTMHGLLFDEFEPALYSIAQWAATHPGEIIVLDFQEYFDDGHATADSWKDLNTLLTKTGIMEYVTIGNGSIKNVTYGQLTENGKKCGIVLFGRSVATSAGVGKFILRDLNGDLSSNDGRLYSNYETNLDADISSSFSADYVQAQVDWMDDNYPTNEDHPIYWAFRIMQAQSESGNLLNQATSDNTSLLNALNNNPEWLTALPVVMVNRVGTNTDGIVELLKSCNVPTETVNYVYNGTTVYSEVGGLVGTLYTNDGFYDTPIYKLVNDANGEYYVSETFYTTPDNGAITRVVKGSTVEVDVTKLGNVYSARYQPSVSGGMLVYDDGGLEHFSAYDWNDANSPHHRIGVAVLEADKDASAYMLKATELRDTTYGQEGTLNFYAVSYEDYLKLDLTKYSSYESVVNSYSPVAYYTTTEWDAYDNAVVTYILDETGVRNAIGDNGKVVIIGAHTHGLYRLSNDIEIVSGWLVTTDDKQTVVANGGSVDVKPAEGAAALSDGEGYILAGESTIESVTKDITLYSVSFGAEMVTGAQVRIGGGVDGDGKVTDGSGLRFITTVNTVDSLAYEVYTNYYDAETNTYTDGYDIGVIITAEGSDVSVKVSATKWQDAYATEDACVYTSALTNLAESNFNRKFKAVPYVTVNGVDVVGDTQCERSIYQVAAGLLVNASTDNTSYDQTALDSEILYKVLNAYVNQTGIRLSLSDTDADGDKEFTARTTGNGAYSGDVFFNVGETTVNGNVYTVTLTPVGEKTEILDYWNGYVRINNNNGQIYVATTLTYNEADDTYTLEFDASKVKSN